MSAETQQVSSAAGRRDGHRARCKSDAQPMVVCLILKKAARKVPVVPKVTRYRLCLVGNWTGGIFIISQGQSDN